MLQKSNFSMQILLLVLCSPSTLSYLHTFGSLSEIGTKVILCEDVRRGLFPSLLFFFLFGTALAILQASSQLLKNSA